MSQSDINDLLERYSRGTTSAEENLWVENWFADHQSTNYQWAQMDTARREKWLDEAFAGVESTIDKKTPVVTMRPSRVWWRITAAAVLLVCFSLFWQRAAIQMLFGPTHLTAMQTKAHQTKMVVLSDGSRIWLNAASELKYPEKFNGATRDVFLTGEAYFDIRHDDRKAFIVHTGSLVTTVLGTAFDISARKTGQMIIVTVTRGKVSVSEGKRLLGFITPNQQISYNKNNKFHVKNTVDANQVVAWQSAGLRFDDITFQEAAKILSERFKVKIIFKNDKIRECSFSGTFLSGKNIDQVLKVICAFNNANFSHNPDGSININGKGCN